MTVKDEDARRWVAAGLIDGATAERILAFEDERRAEEVRQAGRPGVAELLVYLSAAIVGAGVTVLAATNWEHLASALRIAIPATAGAAALVAGYALQQARDAALERAASLAWLLAGALIVGAVAILGVEAGWAEQDTSLAAGVAAVAVSSVLWRFMPMHPQIVGMGGAALLISIAISVRAPEDSTMAALGTSLSLIGLMSLVAVEIGALVPRSSGRLLAGAALGAGAFWGGLPPGQPAFELLAAGAVAVLIASGIRFQSLVYIAFGVLAAFAGMLTLILRHVESPTLAGLALIAIGLLLLVVIAALAKMRPWTRLESPETRTHADPAGIHVSHSPTKS